MDLLVRDIMIADAVAVSPEDSVAQAVALMSARNIGAVVVSDGSAVVGMFTERDLLRRAAREAHRWETTEVGTMMTPEPVTIAAAAPWEQALEQMNTHRIRHLPVTDASGLVGMLSMRDLVAVHTSQLEQQVARRTAELSHSHAKMRASLEAAGKLQRLLLPSEPPRLPPFEFAVLHHPYDHVTGDYYDFIRLTDDRMGVLIADASGHDLSAAFVSVMAKTAFQAYLRENLSPAAMLERINDRMEGLLQVDEFVTKLYAILDRAGPTLTYALAGHPPPIHYRSQIGTAELLDDSGGTMLGIMDDLFTQEHSVLLEPGDSLLLYTDGAMECANAQREQFGTEGLRAFMAQHGGLSSAALLEALRGALQRFADGRPLDDDLTCVAIRLAGAA